jgi:hypothetical protein
MVSFYPSPQPEFGAEKSGHLSIYGPKTCMGQNLDVSFLC